ncbi:MAG: glycosyl transferase [Nitrospirae bacterium]|nr:glycosyl transferase [Nitrospirota bacterium]
MRLPRLVPVSLAEFETRELLDIKPTRTRGEYCWTCTSHVIRHALETYSLNNVTYLDADIFFFSDPRILIDEMNAAGASILVTGHNYTPRYDQSRDCGIYCVQFISFNADGNGMSVLRWWCDRCIEWCFNRKEDGRFGDQKYLDDWPERFKGVHVLRNTGGGVAPWNIQQYRVARKDSGPTVDGVPVVFYHFHNLTWHEDDSFMLDHYRMSRNVPDIIYRPYVEAMRRSLADVRACAPGFSRGMSQVPERKTPFWKTLENSLKGKYRVIH